MEIRQGIVRNYVVTDKEKFCDAMAKALCQMQVSYVQIENEFHFNDKIYRFYNFGDAIQLDDMVTFVCLDREKVLSLSPLDLLFTKEDSDLSRLLDPLQQDMVVEAESIRFEDEKPKQKVNVRQLRQHDNRMINQRIRNSHKQPVMRNRRNG